MRKKVYEIWKQGNFACFCGPYFPKIKECEATEPCDFSFIN